MLGAFGHTLIFVSGLAGLAICVPLWFLHAAHVYITVLSVSSGGVDRVDFPRDGMSDWFGRGFAAIGAMFAGGAIAMTLSLPILLTIPIEWAAAAWGVAWWLIAPLCLIAILSGAAVGSLFDPRLIGRLARQALGVVTVVLITLPLTCAVVAAIGVGLWRSPYLGAILFLIVYPAALLLHARAWGRLVWLAYNCDRPQRRKKKKAKRDVVEPPALDVDLEPELDSDDPAYAMTSAPALTGEKLATMTEWYDRQHERERVLRQRAGDPNPDPFDLAPPPTYRSALRTRVISYLADPETIAAQLTLALCAAPMAFFAAIVRATFP